MYLINLSSWAVMSFLKLTLLEHSFQWIESNLIWNVWTLVSLDIMNIFFPTWTFCTAKWRSGICIPGEVWDQAEPWKQVLLVKGGCSCEEWAQTSCAHSKRSFANWFSVRHPDGITSMGLEIVAFSWTSPEFPALISMFVSGSWE